MTISKPPSSSDRRPALAQCPGIWKTLWSPIRPLLCDFIIETRFSETGNKKTALLGGHWHFTYLRAMPARSQPPDNNKGQNGKNNSGAQGLSSHNSRLFGVFLSFFCPISIGFAPL